MKRFPSLLLPRFLITMASACTAPCRLAVLGVAVEEITQQIDRAIRRFANHQIEEVRVRGASHLVEVVSDTSSHGYVVRCPELLGISVKGRTVEEALEKMKERIAEALAKLSSKDSR